jgi:hypothetical protein
MIWRMSLIFVQNRSFQAHDNNSDCALSMEYSDCASLSVLQTKSKTGHRAETTATRRQLIPDSPDSTPLSLAVLSKKTGQED